ncbi:MAG: acetyltransferase, ribosomal protein N-acetylase [Bacteroidetes bacterium]|nr:MAG: acetyltransferase, ribosomal protein N-acetylase [Bacteroidota bacterium]
MTVIVETERLLLREIVAEDAPLLYELNSDPEVVRYTGDPPFESPEAAAEFTRNYIAKNSGTGYGRWAVIQKESGEFLGWCGLKILEETGEVDLGYRFYRKHWGKGYATESALAVLKYGFGKLKLEKIIGRSRVENLPSIHVLEKCGMTFEKYFTDHDGECLTMAIYAGR